MPRSREGASIEETSHARVFDVGDLTPILISPDSVRPNPRNPRQNFPRPSLERLQNSIAEIGVLVPLTVYHDPEPKSRTEYVLLDGERRWRASKEINYPKIPAWVIPKPDGADNAIRMFNIHMLREDWDELSTARALEQIMEETGERDDKKLQQLTGLSPDRIANMKRVLSFPEEYLDAVEEGEVPYNLLVELDKAVLSSARAEQKRAAKDGSEAQEVVLGESERDLRDMFWKKYKNGVFQDVVELRKVSALINAAQGQGTGGKRAKKALKRLVTEEEMRIDEAYDVGAPGSIEADKMLRDIRNLPDRLNDLLSNPIDPAAKRRLATAVRALRDACNVALKKL